jgi:uncharacterized membrane protein YphA (DoxX/SURF4 family)
MRTAAAHSHIAPTRPIRDIAGRIAAWILAIVLAIGFTFFGGIKLIGRPAMVDEFARIGAGQWLRYLTGVLEVTGAVALLIPRARFYGAVQISAVMVGATFVNIAVLHVPVWKLTAILLAMALALAWLRRREAFASHRR